MTNAVRINHEDRTITITKDFAKKSANYTNTEYKDLMKIKRENPGYEVVVRNVSKKNTSAKKVSFKAMETYIKNHDDEAGSVMKEFERIRNERDFSIEYKGVFGVQKWFFEQYPDLKKAS